MGRRGGRGLLSAGDPHAFRCACCGERTLAEEPFGSGERCVACDWTQDDDQEADPHLAGGANAPSLVEARARVVSAGGGGS